MKHYRPIFWLGAFLAALAALAWLWPPQSTAVSAAPDVFASPINAACTHPAPGVCKLHVDPFTIQIASGNRLEAFQLRANGNLLYDFRTDISNPPQGNYSPSAVKLDFAAACGQTYTINLLARDSGDANFLNAGQAEDIICPAVPYPISLPLMLR